VQGEIAVPEVLGSRSTCLAARFGGFHGRALRVGDVLPLGPPTDSTAGRYRGTGADLSDHRPFGPPGGRIELPFLPGGQWEDFPAGARRAFLERPWRVSHRSDRMGLRLEGEPLDSGGAGIGFVSDGTVTGAIQVAGDGLPIVLGVDRQTTGGYPKLGAVASVALHLLGQAQPGDELVFRQVTLDEAQRTLRGLGGPMTRRLRR
jgi:antagonist of KipI